MGTKDLTNYSYRKDGRAGPLRGDSLGLEISAFAFGLRLAGWTGGSKGGR